MEEHYDTSEDGVADFAFHGYSNAHFGPPCQIVAFECRRLRLFRSKIGRRLKRTLLFSERACPQCRLAAERQGIDAMAVSSERSNQDSQLPPLSLYIPYLSRKHEQSLQKY